MTDKFNAEGYYDPVTYKALSRIEKEEKAARKAASFKPVVYVCSPYSGDISEEHERGLAMFMNKVFLGKCDELWVFGNKITEGMKEEIELAGK